MGSRVLPCHASVGRDESSPAELDVPWYMVPREDPFSQKRRGWRRVQGFYEERTYRRTVFGRLIN